MAEVVLKPQANAEQERDKAQRKARLDEIRALFAAGDIAGGTAAMAAYQAERAEYYRSLEREAVR